MFLHFISTRDFITIEFGAPTSLHVLLLLLYSSEVESYTNSNSRLTSLQKFDWPEQKKFRMNPFPCPDVTRFPGASISNKFWYDESIKSTYLTEYKMNLFYYFKHNSVIKKG